MSTELVPLISAEEGEEIVFDQACKHGQRCGHHAVYCCNQEWPDAPRKCRRTWYTGGEVRDEDCAGFEPQQQAERGADDE